MVYLKAKVLRQQRCAAEAAGGTLSGSPAADTTAITNLCQAMPGKLPLPQAEAVDPVDVPLAAAAAQATLGGPEKGTDAAPTDRREVQRASEASAVGAAAGIAHTAGASASLPNSTVALRSNACPSVLCWDLVGEDEDHLAQENSREYLQYAHPAAKLWSTQSTAGSGATTGELPKAFNARRRAVALNTSGSAGADASPGRAPPGRPCSLACLASHASSQQRARYCGPCPALNLPPPVVPAAATAANQECFPWVDEPTVRAALGLGLDPRELPLLGGPGSSCGNPNGGAAFAFVGVCWAPSRSTRQGCTMAPCVFHGYGTSMGLSRCRSALITIMPTTSQSSVPQHMT